MNNDPLNYCDYLKLDQLLSCQSPKSVECGRPAHDETLFIIVHQAYELWFKQILHELDSIMEMFRKDYINETGIANTILRLERIIRIQKLLIDQLRVLETMTPLDFLDFRDLLIPASGFQSFQFRLIENKLGLRPAQRVKYNAQNYLSHFTKEQQETLREVENNSSLFDLVERWLERIPFLEFKGFNFATSYQAAVAKMLENDRNTILSNPFLAEEEKEKQLEDLQKTWENFDALFDKEKHEQMVEKGYRRFSYKATKAALLIHLYRDQPILHLPFRFLTMLVDIDELMAAWRYRHVLMVLRMIGTKIGTGGTTGHRYLKITVDKYKVFSDLFNLATFLIPRSALSDLPPEVEKQLGYYYSIKKREASN